MAVGTSAYLVNRLYTANVSAMFFLTPWSLDTHRRVKVNKDRAWDVFAVVGLGEKSLMRVSPANFFGNIGI
jgi:hypothetical protein